MLVLPFFSVLALAPVIQGLFDFPLQTAFQAAIFFSCLLWVLSALRRGRIPADSFSKPAAAVIAAAALSFCSMLASPVRALVWPEWGNLTAGFLIFIFSGFLSPEDRKKTNLALRVAAWGTVAIAVVQAFVLKSPQISGSFTNPNALALFAVMILPLAASWKDWWLTLALLMLLIWTQSAGAAVALIAAAGLYARKSLERAEFKKNLPLFALLAIALALVISQVPPQSFVHRLLWWKSAFSMFLSRPFFGFGHAAFTFVYPAYRGSMSGAVSSPHHLLAQLWGAFLAPKQVVGSIYAHSYYLEFLAENGIFCGALWFGLLVYAVKKKTGLAKYSLVAALAHSVIDFGLSVPADFWIFCYLAAPENQGGEREPLRISNAGRLILPAAACVIAAAWLNLCVTHNRALRERSRAISAYAEGNLPDSKNKFKKALEIENGPVPLEALGKIEYRLAFDGKDRGMLFSSAVFFERALLLNPYSASAYRDLAAVYRAAGEEKLLIGLEERKRMVFK